MSSNTESSSTSSAVPLSVDSLSRLRFMKRYRDAAKNLLFHYPTLSSKEGTKLKTILEWWKIRPDSFRMDMIGLAFKTNRQHLKRNLEDVPPKRIWNAVIDYFTKMEPDRLCNILLSIFEIAEADNTKQLTLFNSQPHLLTFHDEVIAITRVNHRDMMWEYNTQVAMVLAFLFVQLMRDLWLNAMRSEKKKLREQRRQQLLSSICVCGKPGTKMCGKCRLRRYCSLDCQRKDWSQHKLNCGKELDKDDDKYDDDDDDEELRDDYRPGDGISHSHAHGGHSHAHGGHGHAHGGHGHAHTHGSGCKHGHGSTGFLTY
eukprot:TRINITY_DN10828_c0_g1_i1.p1 TRINITY_DN10828_c0_g1~~TRINITY_DN10828_c0_g1_i1.p1  ORF type:complete len:347 (-),score=57.65 TRINITY_DN10828_c0_g1_i1:20-964(-)